MSTGEKASVWVWCRRITRVVNSYIERTPMRELGADTRRIDWLADPKNHIGNVQLPREIVERNMHSLRSAIDEAMRNTADLPTLAERAANPSTTSK